MFKECDVGGTYLIPAFGRLKQQNSSKSVWAHSKIQASPAYTKMSSNKYKFLLEAKLELIKKHG